MVYSYTKQNKINDKRNVSQKKNEINLSLSTSLSINEDIAGLKDRYDTGSLSTRDISQQK